MLKVGIMGASGFAGEELIKILLGHPEVKITALAAKIEKMHVSKCIHGQMPCLTWIALI